MFVNTFYVYYFNKQTKTTLNKIISHPIKYVYKGSVKHVHISSADTFWYIFMQIMMMNKINLPFSGNIALCQKGTLSVH